MMAGGVSGWVPIVGVFGSLGVGAVIAVIVKHFLRERTDKKLRDREKEALASLIRIEILINAGSLDFVNEHPINLLSQQYSPPLTIKTWEDARVRLAQLLPGEDIVPVMNYYSNLQVLL